MAAVWLRFRAELRARWRAWLGLALVIGVAAGVVLALAAGARRTDSAYSRFLEAHNGFDVVVLNDEESFLGTGGETASFDPERLERLSGVREIAPAAYFYVEAGGGAAVLVPPDERIGTEINRFKMIDGRPADPGDPSEAVVSFTLAEQYGLGVGSEIPLMPPEVFGEPPPDVPPDVVAAFRDASRRVLEVVPDGRLRVVGVEASPGEFPPQIDGTTRALIHASPALHPVQAELRGINEGGDALMVRLDGGAAGTDTFLSQLERLGEGMQPRLVDQRELAGTVDRSLHTQAVALWLLALLAAGVGVLVFGQLLARLTVLESVDHPTLAAVGMTRGQRALLGLLRATVVAVAAAAVAVALAVALSRLFPTGLAATAEPDPGYRADAAVLAAGAALVVVAVVLLAAWPAWRAARVTPPAGAVGTVRRPSRLGRALTRRDVALPASIGARLALGGRRQPGSVPVGSSLAGVGVGVLALVAALTFAASLTHLLDTPRLYGQNWDVELTTYDQTLLDQGLPALVNDGRVDGIAVGNFRVSFEIGGRGVDGLAFDTAHGDLAPTILEGRRPAAADEVALGSRTLRTLDVGVGDALEVALLATDRPGVPMTVVGRAVFPVFAPAGRLGEGALVTRDGGARISGGLLDEFSTGLLVRFAPGADPEAVVRELSEQFGPEFAVYMSRQGRPTDIVNFGRVESTPYVLGGILAGLAVAALAHLLVSATRLWRRELAILKALGFVRTQVTWTVIWYATTIVAAALVVGVPLGVATGRWTWRMFADNLGVAVEPTVPVLAVATVVVAAPVVAILVAVVPGALAARVRPAEALRTE